MRLGAPVYGANDPDSWVAAHKKAGYGAAYCPGPILRTPADEAQAKAYVDAAAKADLVIAEVGAWSNPIATDDAERKKAIDLNIQRLQVAERIGARCCVNIAGARGRKWDGPHPDNFSPATFDMIVQTVRRIIDEVKPTRTFYTLETMPWIFPDSADSYLDLVKAIDRKAFAVHLDPANLLNSPRRYFDNAKLIRECFEKLGPYIQSCHGKDMTLSDKLMVHLDECRPGTGAMDYTVYLTELAKLPPDTPLMLEHLPNEAEYTQAAHHVRAVAEAAGLAFK